MAFKASEAFEAPASRKPSQPSRLSKPPKPSIASCKKKGHPEVARSSAASWRLWLERGLCSRVHILVAELCDLADHLVDFTETERK